MQEFYITNSSAMFMLWLLKVGDLFTPSDLGPGCLI